MTLREARDSLSNHDFVNVVLGKSDEEKARLKLEKLHKKEANRLKYKRLSEQPK